MNSVSYRDPADLRWDRPDQRLIRDATARIGDAGRKLLALRSYLRAGSRLAERWSWTEQQIAAYAASPEHLALQAEIERVRAAFAAANPGYAFLISYVPEPTPTVAAPGLSPHGQMRAVDFQVEQGGRTVAGPDTRSIESAWEDAGWAYRLEAAVHAATNRLIGPLASPRESDSGVRSDCETSDASQPSASATSGKPPSSAEEMCDFLSPVDTAECRGEVVMGMTTNEILKTLGRPDEMSADGTSLRYGDRYLSLDDKSRLVGISDRLPPAQKPAG